MEKEFLVFFICLPALFGKSVPEVYMKYTASGIITHSKIRPNSNITWLFTRKEKDIWAVQFLDFKSTESENCTGSFLYITDITNRSNDQQYCGSSEPGVYLSSGPTIQIGYYSSPTGNQLTFSLRVENGKDEEDVMNKLSVDTTDFPDIAITVRMTSIEKVAVISLVVIVPVAVAVLVVLLVYTLKQVNKERSVDTTQPISKKTGSRFPRRYSRPEARGGSPLADFGKLVDNSRLVNKYVALMEPHQLLPTSAVTMTDRRQQQPASIDRPETFPTLM